MGCDRGCAGGGGEHEASLGADDRSQRAYRASGLEPRGSRPAIRRDAAARSDLMRGEIDLFGLDTLVNMAVAAGLHVEMRIAEAA
jgi:hypothetical protein